MRVFINNICKKSSDTSSFLRLIMGYTVVKHTSNKINKLQKCKLLTTLSEPFLLLIVDRVDGNEGEVEYCWLTQMGHAWKLVRPFKDGLILVCWPVDSLPFQLFRE